MKKKKNLQSEDSKTYSNSNFFLKLSAPSKYVNCSAHCLAHGGCSSSLHPSFLCPSSPCPQRMPRPEAALQRSKKILLGALSLGTLALSLQRGSWTAAWKFAKMVILRPHPNSLGQNLLLPRSWVICMRILRFEKHGYSERDNDGLTSREDLGAE